mmetsp:Transcript_69845/g.123592  ORF Transcript_69845/g.123592 Transcript_69845/m.123592 type:complete len:285 (-) Transcript_69845:140-994(-)
MIVVENARTCDRIFSHFSPKVLLAKAIVAACSAVVRHAQVDSETCLMCLRHKGLKRFWRAQPSGWRKVSNGLSTHGAVLLALLDAKEKHCSIAALNDTRDQYFCSFLEGFAFSFAEGEAKVAFIDALAAALWWDDWTRSLLFLQGPSHGIKDTKLFRKDHACGPGRCRIDFPTIRLYDVELVLLAFLQSLALGSLNSASPDVFQLWVWRQWCSFLVPRVEFAYEEGSLRVRQPFSIRPTIAVLMQSKSLVARHHITQVLQRFLAHLPFLRSWHRWQRSQVFWAP